MRAAPLPALGHDACVLVVEDEPDLLEVTANLVRGLGCRVIEAGDRETALAHLQKHGNVDLLFTDIVLSGRIFDVGVEDVSGASFGSDQVRRMRIGFDLAARAQDQNVDRRPVFQSRPPFQPRCRRS